MLKLIHRNKNSIGYIFLFIAFCFAISGIGLDVLHNYQAQNYAVKVGDREFSTAELLRAERRIEAQYQRMFGDNYEKLAGMLNLNIAQQALDSIIDGTLLEDLALKFGFSSGKEEVRSYIREKIFNQGEGYKPELYRAFLQNSGMSAANFESEIKASLLRAHIADTLGDVADSSRKEVLAELKRTESTRKVVFAVVDAAALKKDIKAPDTQTLQKYFESRATDFELPARVNFEFAVCDPKSFQAVVPVQQEDLEMYYTENRAKFQTPEEARVRTIKLLYPVEKNPEKMAEVKEKAKKVQEEALTGAVFETLVAKYSDDIPSKATGGSLGWISKGKVAPELEKAIFAEKTARILEPVEVGYGYEIVKVEEFKAAAEKPLEEVKDQISEEIKKAEAPAFAAAKAKEIAEQALKENASLTELESTKGLVSGSSQKLVTENDAVLGAPAGLVAKILTLPESDKAGVQTIDFGDSTVVVKFIEYKTPALPDFTEVEEKVREKWLTEEADKVAREKASALLKAVESGKDIHNSAKEFQASVEGPIEISNGKPFPSQYSNQQLQEKVLRTTKAGAMIPEYYLVGKTLVIAQVTDVIAPDQKQLEEKLDSSVEQASEKSLTILRESLMAHLKKEAEIDYDPSIVRTNG